MNFCIFAALLGCAPPFSNPGSVPEEVSHLGWGDELGHSEGDHDASEFHMSVGADIGKYSMLYSPTPFRQGNHGSALGKRILYWQPVGVKLLISCKVEDSNSVRQQIPSRVVAKSEISITK